jgi:hypothetical protein
MQKKKIKEMDFLEDLKVTIGEILQNKNHETRHKEITVNAMQNFPVNIHYIFEDLKIYW